MIKGFRFRLLLFFAMIGGGSSAIAGWVSSGGDIIKDSHNPWFLRNTSKITYCVSFAADGFSASSLQSTQAIQEAWGFWKTEFAAIPSDLLNETGITSQKFIAHRHCQGDEDLRFIFGHHALNPQETKYFGHDLPTTIASSVRTSYDPVNLRGRGFIFVNSDIGEGSLERADKDSQAPIWSLHPQMLAAILGHELGHVFGIPHSGSPELSVMAEGFPEQLLAVALNPLAPGMTLESKEITLALKNYPFIRPMSEYISLIKPAAAQWFGIAPTLLNPPQFNFMRIHFAKDIPQSREATVFTCEPNQHFTPNLPTERVVGKIVFNSEWKSVSLISSLLIRIWLNPLQKVFSDVKAGDIIGGPPRMRYEASGFYYPANDPKKAKPVLMRSGPGEEFYLMGTQADGSPLRLMDFTF